MTEPQNPPPWTEPGAPSEPTGTPRRRAAWLLWALLGIAVLAVAVLAYLLLRGNADEPADDAAATPTTEATEPAAEETQEPEATTEPTVPTVEPEVVTMPLKPPGEHLPESGISAIPLVGEPLGDGDYFGYLEGVDLSGGTVDIDVAIFYIGQAAIDYLTANDPTAENPPPNDYIIVNDVENVRTVPLSPDVRVWDWCNQTSGGELGFAERTVTEWAAAPAGGEMACDADPALSHGWNETYWFQVRGNVVMQVIGQYLP